MLTTIGKLYVSNFLRGLVFWFGIEKLFMTNIGIDAVGVGIATACIGIFCLALDVPSGLLADKWSRKGTLLLSALSLAIAAVVLGTSTGLTQYIIGYLFFAISIVTSSGTYQALTYDILHEEQRSKNYSKIMGRAYAIFLVGAGVANIVGGFLATKYPLPVVFFLTIASCVCNALVIASIKEPHFHKDANKENMLRQLGSVTKAIARTPLLKILAIIFSMFAVVEVFKLDFGQLYILRYVTEPQLIGILWAIYAFTWAIGSVLAHRLATHLTPLILASVIPLLFMAMIDSWVSLILFMIQATAVAALFNQIETRVQDATPSSIRASVLSVLSAFARIIGVPSAFLMGWIFKEFGAYVALQVAAVVAALILLYWLFVGRKTPRADQSMVATAE